MAARRILAGAFGCLAAARTPLQWQHAAFGPAPTQAEIRECEASAFREAQRQAFFYDFAWPRYYPGPRHPFYSPWPRSAFRDRFFLERDLFDYCMRAKGYRLVPVPSEAG